ncbi:hypothetical protein ACQKDD_18215 [Planococcus kocurii]|uniref:hypothetical protein n=1 Tax=Planococcus TaxID=1372 RepID=UPI0011EFB726|nr:hypothetical protein [Planococcus sp. ANT_H30]KAA0957605.1 hypothetical protein FQ085_05985 [Planococcus sp. ANT_H30]
MRTKSLKAFSILVFLLLTLWGCTDKSSSTNYNDLNSSDQKGDFKVEVFSKDNDKKSIYATLTYIGEEEEVSILHGGDEALYFLIFKNEELLNPGSRTDQGTKAILKQNEPLIINLDKSYQDLLKSGDYQIVAIADMSYDTPESTQYRIPVSTNFSIN